LNALIAGAFAVSLAGAVSSVSFADTAQEKCYGVAKAGQNDCAGASKSHSCSGQSKMDGNGGDFVLLPEGVCAKLVGGSTSQTDAAGMIPKSIDSMMEDDAN